MKLLDLSEYNNKLQELIGISKLPIVITNSNMTYLGHPIIYVDNQYVYKDDREIIIIEIDAHNISLIHIKNNNLLYLSGSTMNSELVVARYNEYNTSFVEINNKSIRLIKANTLTYEIENILKKYGIKVSFRKPTILDYTELDFTLPRLIEPTSTNYNLDQYIPLSKLITIKDKAGQILETIGTRGKKVYQEYSFKISTSLISSNFLPHYRDSGMKLDKEVTINSKDMKDVTTSLNPLRNLESKHLYKFLIGDERVEELTKYYLGYFDDLIYAISYFQNETKNVFYTFEDDIKQLQLK